jgi:5-carboxyvanillate decarboxylase
VTEPQASPHARRCRRIATEEATSGMNWHPALRFCIEAVGADNIMFAIDYPYQLTEGAVAFLDEAPIPDEERHKIFHGNAERIFRIPPRDGG